MNKEVSVSKDDQQVPVPSNWRGVLSAIVEAFKEGDYSISRTIDGVSPVSPEDARRHERNIKAYGATLVSLPDEAWSTSVCQWMDGYWDVLVDLYTAEEGVSDLALAVRVHENGSAYVFDVDSVHVP